MREKQGWDSILINCVSNSTVFRFSLITLDKEGETNSKGGNSTCLLMREGHREAAFPWSPSLCVESFVENERTNPMMWHKVSLFPQLPNKICSVAIKQWESETDSKSGNEIEGNVYLSWLNGKGISVHESDLGRLLQVNVCMHKHTGSVYNHCMIHCAASMHFVFRSAPTIRIYSC